MTDGSAATWAMKNGVAETGKGIIRTTAEFTDFQLHVEFATPSVVKGDSQGRGNSGVFLLGKFEIQVLDSYQNRTYADGAALQRQHAGQAGDRHRDSQRRPRPQRPRILGTDSAQEDRSVHPRQRQR